MSSAARSRVVAWQGPLLLCLGLAVAMLPAVLAGHRALDEGWRPVLDNERLAVDAASFADGRPPLLGAHSTSLEIATGIQPVHHLGPSEAWLFGAVQIVWPGTRALVVSAAALAASAAAVIVLAARRIGGPWSGLAAGAVTGVVAARLGTPILADIWNPYVPILPLAAASVARGPRRVDPMGRGLPLAVLFGTIAAQAHVTHGPLLVAAVVRRRRPRGRPGADARRPAMLTPGAPAGRGRTGSAAVRTPALGQSR